MGWARDPHRRCSVLGYRAPVEYELPLTTTPSLRQLAPQQPERQVGQVKMSPVRAADPSPRSDGGLPPHPAGAVWVSGWRTDSGIGILRKVIFGFTRLDDIDVMVTTNAIQYADSHLDGPRISLHVEPPPARDREWHRVYDHGTVLTADEARQLAAALLQAADELDGRRDGGGAPHE